MKPNNDGGPASPVTQHQQFGLTKREWFAGMALHGLLANSSGDILQPKECAHDAYNIADAMIERSGK